MGVRHGQVTRKAWGRKHIANDSGCENIRYEVIAPTDSKGLAAPTGGHPVKTGTAPFEYKCAYQSYPLLCR